MFLSTFNNNLDDKNRFVLPKEYRNILTDNTFIAFRSYNNDAIDCFSSERMKKLIEKVDNEMDILSNSRENFETAVFADAMILKFDKVGRVVMPDILKEYAGIEKNFVIVGKGSTFQIWEPSKFKEYQELAKAALKKGK